MEIKFIVPFNCIMVLLLHILGMILKTRGNSGILAI